MSFHNNLLCSVKCEKISFFRKKKSLILNLKELEHLKRLKGEKAHKYLYLRGRYLQYLRCVNL